MAKDKFFDIGVKSLKGLTPEQEVKELEKLTEKVLERLPELKHRLTAFDDRNDDLYNLTPEDIRLTSNTYISDIRGNYSSEGLENWYKQLQIYGETNLDELEVAVADARWESFKENIKQVSYEDYNYIIELEKKLDKKTIVEFTRSKFFFDGGDLSSEQFVKFMNEHNTSVGIAKLETFLESKGIETDKKFYETNVTRIKLGRPKKRGRPRKR